MMTSEGLSYVGTCLYYVMIDGKQTLENGKTLAEGKV